MRWAIEREKKKDVVRTPGFQDRDREEIEAWLSEIDESLWLPFERRVFQMHLEAAMALPAGQRVEALTKWVESRGGPEKAIDALFSSPALGSKDARLALLKQKKDALYASTDPFVSLAVALEEGALKAWREESEARRGAYLRLRPVWVEAAREAMGGMSYPDANNTLRITFGRVEGYPVRDGLQATPVTTLSGILAKHRLEAYEAPPSLLSRLAAPKDPRFVDPALGDVPVNFLSSCDTTGGNSGSATLSAEGKLIGLIFDGNYESMAADWQFNATTTRSIHIDIRYIGWWLSQEPSGAWILKEMGL